MPFKTIEKEYKHNFQISKTGLFCISISARCKSGEQTGIKGGEDLRVEIDDKKLREVPPKNKPQYKDIPSAWNGTKLQGLKKTVIFILWLNKGEHNLKFIPEQGAVIEEEPKIKIVEDTSKIVFNLGEQAEDGDCRPWITFSLVDLPLKSLTAEVTVKWRLKDSDDVKLIIDNNIQKNKFSLFHRYWLWSGSIFKKLFQRETQTKIIKIEPKTDLHYIEFWEDKTPVLHRVELELGKIEPPKRIPTVDDPKWTEDFNDDTEQMILARLIFGEARNQPYEAKLWIAWSVINRVKAKAWSDTIHGVILEENQYDPFKINDVNFLKIADPLKGADQDTEKMWYVCYGIADNVVSGKWKNPTEATHFHGKGVTREWFEKYMVPNGRFLKKTGDTYFYWSPN